MTDDSNPDTDYLGLTDPVPEDIGEEVHKTNTELEKLRLKLEDIEKQKVWLEELRRRQGELEQGRTEMIDKFTRSLGTVQRETEETHKRLEQLNAIHNSFTQHLRYIESVNPKAWGKEELPKELSKAISALEDARADYTKALAKISPEVPSDPSGAIPAYETEYGVPEEKSFGYWLRSGLAFTLPLLVLGTIALLLWLWSVFAAAPAR